ncbi:MAG: arylsulfatase [Gammaproteobacteria bacterium]|nr:arylsulfatase [Gammaproteobacteria bacterium]
MPGSKQLKEAISCIVVLLLAACSGQEAPSAAAVTEVSEPEQPNILLIVADDLGYADLGFYGSEIPTPNLDMLAANGMLLTDFYTSMTCGPTRSMLMSGTDNHMAGVGVQSAPSHPDHIGDPNYLGYLSFRVASLAELMTEAGYNTYMTGKWHLGMDVENGAHARGFKKNFISLDGAAHLGPWDWRGPQNANYRDGDEMVQVNDDWYTVRDYTGKMVEYIGEDRDEDKPFFAFLAYTTPHWPLQAPADVIANFDGVYDDGYEATYLRRLERMKELGHVPEEAEPMPMDIFSPRWEDLDSEEKAYSAKRMEIYAAMVSELDKYVGQVVDYLKEIGEFDNTFIMFMSDNGAESARLDLSPRYQEFITGGQYDQSLENLGSATSYVMYGRNWATVSETRFRRHKATGFEGGIHVPAFVHFPSMVEPGTRTDGFGTVMDVLPTFLAIAGTQHPGTSFQGREVVPIKGKSLLPMLTGETEEIHDGYTGWELNGHRTIREGEWKIVWDRAAGEDAKWLLFNIEEDPMEQKDLATELPDKLAQMVGLWERYEEENGVIYVYPE